MARKKSLFYDKPSGMVNDASEVPVEAVVDVPAAPTAPASVPLKAPPSKVLAAPPKVAAWRVKKAKQVSIQGGMTLLPEGTIISESSYGPGIYERLVDQGVELEAC